MRPHLDNEIRSHLAIIEPDEQSGDYKWVFAYHLGCAVVMAIQSVADAIRDHTRMVK